MSLIDGGTPEAFFADFIPHDVVEGHLRQAMVLSWMMMPRAGGREFKDTVKIIQRLYDRNVAAWEEDERTFTKGPSARNKSLKAPKKTKKVTRKK